MKMARMSNPSRYSGIATGTAENHHDYDDIKDNEVSKGEREGCSNCWSYGSYFHESCSEVAPVDVLVNVEVGESRCAAPSRY